MGRSVGLRLDNPGAVKDGDEGGSYLLASPSWKGEVPKGIKRVVRGETDFLGTLTRTGLNGPQDLPNMEKTQQGYKLQPLSSFLGKPHRRRRRRSSGSRGWRATRGRSTSSAT